MPDPNTLGIPQELLILGAAVNTGIIDNLKDHSLSSQDLANKLKLDSRAVWTVLEALVALGYVASHENKYTLAPSVKEIFYNPHSQNYTGFSFMHRYNLVERWAKLPDIMKSGKPFQGERDAKDNRYFIEAMSHNARQSAVPIAEFLLKNIKKGAKVLDIGGGPLAHAIEFSKRGAKVSVLDTPEVIQMNQAEADAHEIIMIPGNFTETLPDGPFDIAYLGNICHIIGEKENQALIQKTGNILNSGGKIAIVDFIRGTNPGAALFAVNMLVNTDTGGTYTLKQYTDWLKSAGFADVSLNVIAERQIVTGIKK
jgi:SAM-dependent methyltransferase